MDENGITSVHKFWENIQPPQESNFNFSVYPNPFNTKDHNLFNDEGHVRFISNLGQIRNPRIDIFNFSMDHVKTLNSFNEITTTGEIEFIWDGKNSAGNIVANGVYFCKIQDGKYVFLDKISGSKLMKLIIILLLSILCADYGGGYAGSEFQYQCNARDLGLATSNLSQGSKGYLQYTNPAQLYKTNGWSLSTSILTLPLDRSAQTFSISKNLPPFAGIAFSFYRSAVSGIDGRDDNNKHTELLENSNLMGMLSFGIAPTNKVSLGINIKYYNKKVSDENPNNNFGIVGNYKGNGIGIDLGLEYSILKDVIISYKIENLSSEMNWKIDKKGDESRQSIESFPLYHHIGTSYLLKNINVFVKYLGVKPMAESLQHKINVGAEVKFSSIDLFCEFQSKPIFNRICRRNR